MPGPAAVTQTPRNSSEVTNFLLDWRNGDRFALDRLAPIIYDGLLRLAKARLRPESRECTLGPTALVHESYLRLADQGRSGEPRPLLCQRRQCHEAGSRLQEASQTANIRKDDCNETE